jgi:hypothetical protein
MKEMCGKPVTSMVERMKEVIKDKGGGLHSLLTTLLNKEIL